MIFFPIPPGALGFFQELMQRKSNPHKDLTTDLLGNTRTVKASNIVQVGLLRLRTKYLLPSFLPSFTYFLVHIACNSTSANSKSCARREAAAIAARTSCLSTASTR